MNSVIAHYQRRSKQQATTMASTTDLNQLMAQVRANYPDGRTRQHKQAVKQVYESTIADLIRKNDNLTERLSAETTKNKQLRSHAALANYDKETAATCHICMDDMCGRVTLVCGHEMCPECFAKHSRINNNCPFCREDFAPKPKIQSRMPLNVLDHMAESWANSISFHPTNPNYFTRQRMAIRALPNNEADKHVKWLVTENGKILMEKVKEWYDKDIDSLPTDIP